MNRKLYLFDFDGTLTKKDTLFDFLSCSFQKEYSFNYFLFTPLFVLAKLNILDKGKVKEKFISKFLKGFSKTEIDKLSNNYFENNYKNLIYTEADQFIKSINNYNDKFIVSASLDFWLQPFADYYDMGLICTNSDFDQNGIFTGCFSSPNCNYLEKKNRIEKEINLSLYDEIIAYGDTNGDKAMFSIANKTYFKFFK